jgi:DNA polymerase III epsilon subunit family exonuclease
MSSQFQNSIFYDILMNKKQYAVTPLSIMGGVSGSYFLEQDPFMEKPFVVFDFETTGLDTRTARIIEIGAIKYHNKKEIGRFSQLINPSMQLPKEITRITGITDSMLEDMPHIQHVLPAFHDFLRGAIGVAHNAEYDVGMLFHESNRLGISCDYTVICTLKLARAFVKLESRNLDALSKYYGLEFISRHRSIGDILVTAEVLWKILEENQQLQKIADLFPYRELMPSL